MRMTDRMKGLAFVGGTIFLAAAAAAMPAGAELGFTTLGTNSGPIPSANRSEPASLVQYGDQMMLVDAGDGASEQLAKAGVALGQIQTILISHLHFDHTGGLFAFLGERYQSREDSKPLTIYGPLGTKRLVDTLLAAMKPGMETTGWAPGPKDAANDNITVVEVGDGSKFAVGEVTVTAAENTHYITLAYKGPEALRPVSLSYRFDASGRSICFTGDTGPSSNVERLCHGVSLLVSEITWPPAAVEAHLRKMRADISDAELAILMAHFTKEHLSPTEVGILAVHSGAQALVLTHDPLAQDAIPAARAAIAANYKGPITFATDLQHF